MAQTWPKHSPHNRLFLNLDECIQGDIFPLQGSQNYPLSFSLEMSPQCFSGQIFQESSYHDRMVLRRSIFLFSLSGMRVLRTRNSPNTSPPVWTSKLWTGIYSLCFELGYILLCSLKHLGITLWFSPIDRWSIGEAVTEVTLILGEGFPDSTPVAHQGMVPKWF